MKKVKKQKTNLVTKTKKPVLSKKLAYKITVFIQEYITRKICS